MNKQTTSYSCSAASLVAINEIIECPVHYNEMELVNLLGAKPLIGVDTDKLLQYCRSFYGKSIHSYGEGTYHGGLALANIKNWRDGIGHFVVFLNKINDNIFIFDPFDGLIHMKKFSDIDFVSGCGGYKEFSINFM